MHRPLSSDALFTTNAAHRLISGIAAGAEQPIAEPEAAIAAVCTWYIWHMGLIAASTLALWVYIQWQAACLMTDLFHDNFNPFVTGLSVSNSATSQAANVLATAAAAQQIIEYLRT
jgi:hypothetical protein